MIRGSPAQVLHRVLIQHESDVVVARHVARDVMARHGFRDLAAESVAIAVTEIARNIVVHAGRGEISFGIVADPPGMVVVATDEGPGIPHLACAMQDGFSTSGGLGFGLAGAQRLMDEFEIESQTGSGTTIIMKKWSRDDKC